MESRRQDSRARQSGLDCSLLVLRRVSRSSDVGLSNEGAGTSVGLLALPGDRRRPGGVYLGLPGRTSRPGRVETHHAGRSRGRIECHRGWRIKLVGFLLASVGLDGKVLLWQPTNRRSAQVGSFQFTGGEASVIAWSPDDKSIAAGAGTGAVAVFRAGDEREPRFRCTCPPADSFGGVMRADMEKVLVERPRLGRSRAAKWPGKGYRKRSEQTH